MGASRIARSAAIAALAGLVVVLHGAAWYDGRLTLRALERIEGVSIMDPVPDELVDEWTARLGESGTRRVTVRTHREAGENDVDFVARHEALVQARAAVAEPIN